MTLAAGATLSVIAAGGLWVASHLTWIRLRTFDHLGEPRTIPVSGSSWSAALVPMAAALVAVAIATLAVRGWPLRVLALVVAAVGAGAAYLGVGMWMIPDIALRAAEVQDIPIHIVIGADRVYGGPAITLVAAVLAVTAAVALLRAARRMAATDKYRIAANRTVQDADSDAELRSERDMWDSLDDGKDPTIGPT